MSQRQITVLGECVADAFVESASASSELALRVLPGGGPANTAVALTCSVAGPNPPWQSRPGQLVTSHAA
ncbi:hypothetical protein ACZ91_46320 [Streptomyces regensis]|nr:hypothetical protein ACZ91_46320 [Streptomyces regensis]